MNKCPKCGCTKYISSGKFYGKWVMVESDIEQERDEILDSGVNSDIYGNADHTYFKCVTCYECGTRYKKR